MGMLATLQEPPKQAQQMEREHGVTPPVHVSVDGKSWYQERYEYLTSEWCDNVYDSATRLIAQEPEIAEIQKYLRYLSGEQWIQDRPSYRSKPVFNRLLSVFYQQLALLSDVKMNTNVGTNNHNHKKLAENLTKLSFSNWLRQSGDLKLLYTVMHASVTGVGYTKLGFDPVSQQETFLPCGPDMVVPVLPSQTEFQESGGVIYRALKPISWAKERYPSRYHLIKPDAAPYAAKFPVRPYQIPEYTWQTMNPGMRDFLSADTTTRARGSLEWGQIPVFLYNEFWYQDPQINTSKKTMVVGWGNYAYTVKPGEMIFPFGRLTSTAGQSNRIVLYDGPNIHWHAKFPFAKLVLRPFPSLLAGFSDMRDLYPINNVINQMWADTQDYSKQILNPVVIARDRQLSPESWDDYFSGMPGAKLRVIGPAGNLSDVIRFERPDPSVLTVMPQLITLAKQFFDEQSGMTDMGRLAAKKQVPSESTIEAIRDPQQSVYRLKGRFIEDWQRDVGELQIADLLQYKSKKEIVSSLGADGLTWTYWDWDPESVVSYVSHTEPFRRGREFVRYFNFDVMQGSALPSQRREYAMIMMQLALQHKISIRTLYDALRSTGVPIPEYDIEMERIRKEFEDVPQLAAKPTRQRQPRQ